MPGFDNIETIGAGSAVIMPSSIQRPAPPTKEVVPAGTGWMPGYHYSLPRIIDDLTRTLGFKAYEAMLTDPAVASSYNTHKMAILKGGVRLVSPMKQSWAKDRVLKFNEGTLDAMAFGSKLGEVTYRIPEEGEDKDKLVWDSLKVKPNWAWRFVVDNHMNIAGVLTYWPLGGYIVYPPDKFGWLSWMPKDSDPRGTSILRAAYNAWNLKIQAWPNYYNFQLRFGQPGLDFEMAAGDDVPTNDIDANGIDIPNAPQISRYEYYSKLLSIYRGGGSFVHPAESKLVLSEPKSSGEALLKGFDLYNREIMLAIEYQTRAALEAEHGSRADSQTAENRKSLATDFGSDWLSSGLYRSYHRLVEVNYGREDADMFTPWPTFGNTDAKDRPDLWLAGAAIGYKLANSQLQDMDAELGLPIRQAGDESIAGTPPAPKPGSDTANTNSQKKPVSGSK